MHYLLINTNAHHSNIIMLKGLAFHVEDLKHRKTEAYKFKQQYIVVHQL